jgi:chemotaxis protein methyltransferase CheR
MPEASKSSATPHLDALVARLEVANAARASRSSTLVRPSATPASPIQAGGGLMNSFVFPGQVRESTQPGSSSTTSLNSTASSTGLKRPEATPLARPAIGLKESNSALLGSGSRAIARPSGNPTFASASTSVNQTEAYNNGGTHTSSAVMTPQELTMLCALVEEVCSLSIGPEKQYLLETRLIKLLAEYNCDTYAQFVSMAKGIKQAEIRPKLIDAMTTKETLWFRDEHPYETFKAEILPRLLEKKGSQPLKIWSAASSTGQEPYSIAMSCIEYAYRNPSSYLNSTQGVQISATDIAPSSIMLSRLGRYDSVAMGRGLSEERKQKFFTPQGRVWLVNDEVKKLTQFEQFNLQNDPSKLGQFDMIFMRNVAIYFSKEFKQELYARLAKVLKPHGYLMIGATESMVGLETPFKSVQLGRTTVYQLK